MHPNEPFQTELFRRGVGIMLVNAQKQVWLGERIDTPNAWQMPQGGIDEGETLEQTVLRELYEETGIPERDVKFVSESQDWLTLVWPEEVRKNAWNGKFHGQNQKWFLLELISAEDKTNLTLHEPEFANYQWASLDLLDDLVVGFKKELYSKIIKEFRWYFDV